MLIKANLRKPLLLRGNKACSIFNEALLIPATGNAVCANGCGVEREMIDVPVVLDGVALRNVKMQNW